MKKQELLNKLEKLTPRSALVYNEDIAKHYCTPSELRKVTHKDGTISERANAGEIWLDVQARALNQAARLIKKQAGL